MKECVTVFGVKMAVTFPAPSALALFLPRKLAKIRKAGVKPLLGKAFQFHLNYEELMNK